MGPLDGLRVLEVAGPFGEYTGKLFADFGADVILLEAPEGAPGRRRPPFVGDVPGVDRSLDFAYFNGGKRGATLDLDSRDGQAIFRRLAATADVVIESEPVGRMEERGLDPPSLLRENERLVHTSITPFGHDGPWAGHDATDIVLLAAGGLLNRGGYVDAAPVRAGGDQARLAAGQFAAVGTMLAVLEAEETGIGRWVDVSAQQCVVMAQENAIQYWDLENTIRGRSGERQRQAGIGVYPASDGDIYLLANGLGPFWDELVGWLEEEGVTEAARLRDDRWQDQTFAESQEAKDGFMESFGAFSRTQTKAQLYEAAKRHRLPLCPVNTPADLVASPHLLERDYFVPFQHPLAPPGAVMPGAPFKSSATGWGSSRPAPGLGADTAEIMRELGFEGDDLSRLGAAGVV